MLQWFQKASSTIVSNVSIDAIKHIQGFEVSKSNPCNYLFYCPDDKIISTVILYNDIGPEQRIKIDLLLK